MRPSRRAVKAIGMRVLQLAHILSRQILRSGTSIGANLAEATGAQSLADFIAKLSIALKEAYETRYWLRLLFETQYLSQCGYQSLLENLNESIAMLNRSILTNKGKLGGPNPSKN